MESSLSDEKTLWEPANYGLRDARMAHITDEQPRRRKKTSTTNPDHDEPFHCQEPGCTRRFINQSELNNHMAVMHGDVVDSSPPPPVHLALPLPLRPKPVERRIHLDYRQNDDVEQSDSPLSGLETFPREEDDDACSEIARSVSAFSRMTMSDVMPASSTHSIYTDSIAVRSDVALSDIAETESQEVQRPVRMLIHLWKGFINQYTKNQTQGMEQHGAYGQSEGQSAGSHTAQTRLHRRSSSNLSTTSSSKRRRDSDEGDENGRPKQIKLGLKPESTSPKDRPLACPFNKFDSIQFGERNRDYHVCSTWNSVKTAYLKQHLQRTHCPPSHCCPRCQNVFKTPADLREHQRLIVPCEVKDLDKQKILPEDQDVLGLRNRNSVGQDREEYWFQVFDTVFPRERQNRAIDPYYRGPAHEVLERFLRFSELRLPGVLARARRDLRIESDTTPQMDAELYRNILQEANQTFMSEITNAPPVDLRQLKQTSSNVSDIEDQEAEETVKIYDKKVQPLPQPKITLSEEDFTQMGQSTHVDAQQPITSAFTLNQRSAQSISMPSQPVNPAMLEMPPAQDFQPDPALDFFPYTAQDLEEFINDGGIFDNAIEDTELYGASDAALHGWEEIRRHP